VPEPLSESDLLALIEGASASLTPERLDAIRDALRADPALRERIERMARDRGLLTGLPDRLPAPASTTEAALRRAAHAIPDVERSTTRRRTAMLAAAAVGIALLAGLFAFILRETNPALRAPIAHDDSSAQRPQMRLADSRAPATASAPVGPVAPETESAAAAPTTTAQDIAAELDRPEQSDAPDPLLDAFLANIDARNATEAPGAPSDADIVDAFRRGALAIRITASGPSGVLQADARAPTGVQRPDPAIPAEIITEVPADATPAEILAALEDAVKPLRARAGNRIEFIPCGPPGASTIASSPAVDPDAVLWWSRDPRRWRAMREHTIPVIGAAPAATPDAPPSPSSD